jgi:hypothetical protein
MFIATSSNYTESQFKYGVKVTASSTGQVLQFLVTPDVDGKLIFDLQSVVKLRNEDSETMQQNLLAKVSRYIMSRFKNGGLLPEY